MKKIFITISRGSIARNLLQNDFYRILREKYNIVVLTPAFNDKRFIDEFRHRNVIFLPLVERPWQKCDCLISKLHKMLIWNPSVQVKFKYGILNLADRETPRWRYLLAKLVFLPLSKIKLLRDIVRWIDYHFLQRPWINEYITLIKAEQPYLIISTHVTSDAESALIKAAKKCRVPVWAMPKSWDNLSDASFRVKADKFIVWNQFMKERAIKYQNYSPHAIEIIGVPQYDSFVDNNRLDNFENFCKKFGLSPDRKIIFFGSEGKLFPKDAEIASMIYDFIINDQLVEKCQLLLRPHYGYRNDEVKFSHLLNKPFVAIDLYNNKSSGFRDQWDYSEAFTNRFINSIFHSSVIINTCSTLALDGASLDKPVINIMFDGYESLPYAKSLVRWYDNDYYREVLKTGATRKAHDEKELKACINEYLRNPLIDAGGREKLRERFCLNIDGKTGERYANLVIGFLEKSI